MKSHAKHISVRRQTKTRKEHKTNFVPCSFLVLLCLRTETRPTADYELAQQHIFPRRVEIFTINRIERASSSPALFLTAYDFDTKNIDLKL